MTQIETYDFNDFRFLYTETTVAWLVTTIYIWSCDIVDVNKYANMSLVKAAAVWRIKKIIQTDNWAWIVTTTMNFPIDADWNILQLPKCIWNNRATLDYKPLS